MLEAGFGRRRQERLIRVLHERKLDAVVLGQARTVYYFTAHWPFWLHSTGLVLFADGTSLLIAANEPARDSAADRLEVFQASWNGTQRQEQPQLVAERALSALKARGASRVGIDASPVTAILATGGEAKCVPIDQDLFQIRRRKDPDELALMRRAIGCTGAMYERARQMIAPDVAELDVFNQLHSTAVHVAGEPLSDHLGNDYACGAAGGPPRKDRIGRRGELYILDLGPAVRGYFSDNCRTFSVDHHPTDAQMKAWHVVTGVFPMIERIARPGASCREIYRTVDEYFRDATGKPFPHHLGHGVGLQPHEFPHLNPEWDDVLMEGEVFTCEPGLYGPELGGGLRIENQYLVTANGVENLTPFAMNY